MKAFLTRVKTAAGDQGRRRLAWIAILDAVHDVAWHATHSPLQLDGMSNVVSPETILVLCGSAVPRHQILRTSQLMPKLANICICCGWVDESPGSRQ
jgi:NAD dependent epimerase/dehydratase family enzyme